MYTFQIPRNTCSFGAGELRSSSYDTLISSILLSAERQPEKPAVIFKGEQLTYRDLAEKMKYAAAGLKNLGLKRGDRVLFSALSKPEAVIVYLGIQYYGAVAIPVEKSALPEKAAFIYDDTKAALFLTDRPMGDYEKGRKIYSLKNLCAESCEMAYVMPAESEIAEILYTSGTTGTPKGVVLTYKAVYHILKNTIEGIGIKKGERLLLPLPLNHSLGLRELRAVLYRGASVVLQNGFTFAREIEKNLNLYQCTALAAVPASVEAMARQMKEQFADIMGKFRYLDVGAGALSTEQRKKLVKMLPDTTIYNTWGSTESGGALFLNVTEAASDSGKLQAVGKPLPWIQVRVLGDKGEWIAGEKEHPGRMALKGDMLMSGYWNREALTKQTLKEGWLITSDMVYLDTEGYVYMLGRVDDIINVGGEKVSPVEVENAASEYPHIRECACIGVADPEKLLGMVPVLFVVSRDSEYSEEELRLFLAKRLERYKLPVQYIYLAELPRNQMGKIDRKALAIFPL